MSNIVIYDPNAIVVNRVISYLKSVNTPDYDSVSNKLVNPDLAFVSGIDQKYWKVGSNNVIEMSSDEKILIDNYLKSKSLRQLNYRVSTYDSLQRLTTDTYYDTDNKDGTYSGIAQSTLYMYFEDSVMLLTKTVKTYCYDETEYSSQQYQYFKNDNNIIIEKKV